MGTHVTVVGSERGVPLTYDALFLHPNFELPALPRTRRRDSLVAFVLESVARFVSPPKVEGEDEEFACEDIANAIRTQLKPKILSLLREKRP